LSRAAAAQHADPASLLNRNRSALAWRRTQPVLRQGEMQFLPAHDAVLAFVRRHPEGSDRSPGLLCAFNLSADLVHYTLPPACRVAALDVTHPLPAATLSGQTLVLPPCGAAFATL
jgi:alpha-glucosidase